MPYAARATALCRAFSQVNSNAKQDKWEQEEGEDCLVALDVPVLAVGRRGVPGELQLARGKGVDLDVLWGQRWC